MARWIINGCVAGHGDVGVDVGMEGAWLQIEAYRGVSVNHQTRESRSISNLDWSPNTL